MFFFHFSACNCDAEGSNGITCDASGACSCKDGFKNTNKCDERKDNFKNTTMPSHNKSCYVNNLDSCFFFSFFSL